MFGKDNRKVKLQKKTPKKKFSLELLHQRLGHRSTIYLLADHPISVWKDIELKVDPEPFCTSCQIPTINKKPRSKIPLQPKTPFKWVLMDISPATSPRSFTKDTTFANYILIVDAYPKLPRLYGM